MIKINFKKIRKYKNKITVVDDIIFHSRAEAGRYLILKNLQSVNFIQSLTLQPKFALFSSSGKKICTYIADFQYFDNKKMKWIVEDVKGVRTREYITKSKWFKADYPEYEFLEIRAKR